MKLPNCWFFISRYRILICVSHSVWLSMPLLPLLTMFMVQWLTGNHDCETFSWISRWHNKIPIIGFAVSLFYQFAIQVSSSKVFFTFIWFTFVPHHHLNSYVLLCLKKKKKYTYFDTDFVFVTFPVCVSGAESAALVINFTLHDENVNWNTAKSRCEALGQRLAVLDTPDKLATLREQVWVKILGGFVEKIN